MSWWQESTPVGDTSNLTKFLNFLSQAEGADYNTIVGGSKFDSFDAHPGVVGLRTKEGPSTAAGRYQITKTTYNDVAPRLGIKDFSPQSQDAIAIELIRRGGAYDDVVKGNFEAAINKLGGTWASLPSSPYSQPKKSWADVNRMLGVQVASNNASNNWWAGATPVSDAPSNDNWWSGATPVQQAEPAPQAAPARPQPAPARPQAAPAAAAPQPAPAKKEEPRSVLRRVDDFVRGVADAVTFGYADEIAGKLDSLVGGGQSGKTNYKDAVAAQRQRDSEGGVERIAGQVTGSLAPTVGVIRAVPTASRLARAGAGATTGAIQGGLYGSGSAEEGKRLEGAATGAAFGAATGGVLGGVLPATQGQKAATFIRGSGDDAAARLDAEIITDIKKIADSQTKRGNPVSTIDLNAIENKYINEVNQAITALSKVSKDFDAGPLRNALQNRRALTPEELAPLRGNAAGNAVADAIEKAQRARSLTQAAQSSGGIMPLVREANRWFLPERVSTPLNAVLGGRQTREMAAQRALKQADTAENVLQRLGPSQATRSAQELNSVVKQADADWLANAIGSQRDRIARQRAAQEATAAEAARKAAEKAAKAEEGRLIREGGEILKQKAAEARAAQGAKQVAARSGGKATDPAASIADLQAKDPTYLLGLGNRFGPPRNADQMAEFSKVMQNQMEARAQRALANREIQKTVSELAKGPRVDPRIQVLQDSRRPLSGAFQELLQGGRSGLNMTSDQAIEALRLTSRQFKDRPLGQAAQDILRSGNVNDEAAFYGLQNQLRKLQERGVVAGQQPGALSAETGRIFNQTSYDATVRTAEAARDAAIKSAPSPSLKQFAIDIANEKNPALKLEKFQSRVKATSDPEELGYLLNMVDPLTKFGKKAKK